MSNIKVVIGSNFGDEGKGLMTDYFASKVDNGVVVRFCGGTQAGHTVVTPDGNHRHVFGHIGAGAFAGLPTYLSSFFIVNPMTFYKEYTKLASLIDIPTIYIDEDSVVTTPYDMMINQIAEIVRGNLKHGSCGLGINETIERSIKEESLLLKVRDLENESLVRRKLNNIKDIYVFKRLEQLGIKAENIPERYKDLIFNKGIIEAYINDVNFLLRTVKINNINILNSFNSIVFEGSQGLLLDQSHEYFPHVTRSNTGLKNVREIINNLVRGQGYQEGKIEVVYTTRAYMTRHGAGLFYSELPEKPYKKIEDLTNVPNPYQGALRFGLLDVDLLSKTIKDDIVNGEGLNLDVKLAISCIDQLDEKVEYILNGEKKRSSVDIFIKETFNAVGVKNGYLSHGASRTTIKPYNIQQ